MAWHENPQNKDHLRRLRDAVHEGGSLLVFLGAGLSFGAARSLGRGRFDDERWKTNESGKDKNEPGDKVRPKDPPRKGGGPPFTFDTAGDDDGQPLPSWPWLISRMRAHLAWSCAAEDQPSLTKFFRDEGPLDCAQLFRRSVGESNYREFLVEQFDTRKMPGIGPTPSHSALVALGLPIVFTTNFDELLEDSHRAAGIHFRVSSNEEEFKARLAEKPERHIVKLHGSIDKAETIVLTRSDYSKARSSRREMLAYLKHGMTSTSFLFVGFSLSDPNFNLIRDDIRDSMGINLPASYTVQGRHDPVKERYLMSLDVNTVWLDTWNNLPEFFLQLQEPAGLRH